MMLKACLTWSTDLDVRTFVCISKRQECEEGALISQPNNGN